MYRANLRLAGALGALAELVQNPAPVTLEREELQEESRWCLVLPHRVLSGEEPSVCDLAIHAPPACLLGYSIEQLLARAALSAGQR